MRTDTDVITIDRFIWFSGESRSVCALAYRWLGGKLFVCATELEGINKGPTISMAHEPLRAAVLSGIHANHDQLVFIERWIGEDGEAEELHEVYDSGLGFYDWRPFDLAEFHKIFAT